MTQQYGNFIEYLLSSVFIFLPFTYFETLDSFNSAIDPFQINSWNFRSYNL